MTVEELLNQKNIYFKVSGNDYLVKCLNPEHEDDDPSMRIDRIMGVFNCLSCGYKGNLFHKYDEASDKVSILREKLKRDIATVRSSSGKLSLPEPRQDIDYDYRVSKETLQEFEAFKALDQEFADRINFPIRDIRGRIVCFIGRAENTYEKVKYSVSPKGATTPLFPMHKAVPVNGHIMLVEGIFDMLNLWDSGFRNVLCAFGTRKITKAKLNLLKLVGVTHIDLCFDPDDAGQDAAEEVKVLAESLYFKVRNINLKDTDPGGLKPNRASRLRNRLYGKDGDN